jgi:hypothetical protein
MNGGLVFSVVAAFRLYPIFSWMPACSTILATHTGNLRRRTAMNVPEAAGAQRGAGVVLGRSVPVGVANGLRAED